MNTQYIFPYGEKNCVNLSLDKLNIINNHIVDPISKDIFWTRVALSVTGDLYQARKLILSTGMGRRFFESLKSFDSVYVYGAGVRGNRIVLIL